MAERHTEEFVSTRVCGTLTQDVVLGREQKHKDQTI